MFYSSAKLLPLDTIAVLVNGGRIVALQHEWDNARQQVLWNCELYAPW